MGEYTNYMQFRLVCLFVLFILSGLPTSVTAEPKRPTDAAQLLLLNIYDRTQEALATTETKVLYKAQVVGNNFEVAQDGATTYIFFREALVIYGFNLETRTFAGHWILENRSLGIELEDLKFILDTLEVALGYKERTHAVIDDPVATAKKLGVRVNEYRQNLPIETRTAKLRQGKLATTFVSAPSEFMQRYILRRRMGFTYFPLIITGR